MERLAQKEDDRALIYTAALEIRLYSCFSGATCQPAPGTLLADTAARIKSRIISDCFTPEVLYDRD